MIKIKFIAILMTTFGLVHFVSAQTTEYPFEVAKSRSGGKSIILIPGFGCSGEVWKETRSIVEPAFTCYTLTMAGFAGAPVKADASFKNWENGIARFIKDKGIKTPILLGHSMGGSLAMALAADYPDLVSKVIVVDAVPCLSAMANPAFQASANTDCTPIVNQMKSFTEEQFYQMQRMGIASMLADTSRQKMVVSWTVRSDRKTFAEMFCDFTNTDLREAIGKIKCPALILLEADFKHLKTTIETQYKNLKTASLRYADKGKHFIMYDDENWYFSQLKSFLN